MLIELLVATAALLPAAEVDVPADGRLPNGGRACLIVSRCDPRPCVLPVPRPAARPLPLPPVLRCRPRDRRPAPRVVPATDRG